MQDELSVLHCLNFKVEKSKSSEILLAGSGYGGDGAGAGERSSLDDN